MVAFDGLKSEYDERGVSIVAACSDTLENASLVQEELRFPVAHGVTREQAMSIGSWWEDRRAIIQPAEFILTGSGQVVSATYSTGPVGRLMPEDALTLIEYRESLKNKTESEI